MGEKIKDMSSDDINRKMAFSELGFVVGTFLTGGGTFSIGAEFYRNISDVAYKTPKEIMITAIALVLIGGGLSIPSIVSNVSLQSEKTRRLTNNTWVKTS